MLCIHVDICLFRPSKIHLVKTSIAGGGSCTGTIWIGDCSGDCEVVLISVKSSGLYAYGGGGSPIKAGDCDGLNDRGRTVLLGLEMVLKPCSHR